ncbi:Ig-like domain-containing protein [Marinoscillum sp.]|uniref:Ig-like domain-containing protein n=1 Tax=Marinoscillum sp. TaxID=2024838 RepID=UPI003BABA471
MRKPFLLILLLVTWVFAAQAADHHVYSGQSIQSAINGASSGDQVIVHAGTYNQNPKIDSKSNLVLTSAGDGEVIIQGNGTTVDVIEIVNSSNITVSNFTIKNTRKVEWSTGIYVHGAGNDIDILNNNITDIAYHSGSWDAGDEPQQIVGVNPLMVSGDNASTALTDITVAGNTVSYCMTGWNESITIKANVDGFVVENNTVHHVTNIAIDAYGLGSWPNAAQARNGAIRSNLVYNAICNYTDNGGIYVDGGKDIVIENNIVYNSLYGYTLGCENQGNVTGGTTSNIKLLNNIAYNNARAAVMIGTGGDDDGEQGEVVDCLLSGNTFLKNSTSSQWGSELVLQNCSNIELYNNIVSGLWQQMVSEGPGVGTYTSGYNIFYNPVGSPLTAQEVNNWATINFSTWKGQVSDNTSSYTDPLLVSASPTSPDFHLQSSSPAINAGDPSYTLTGSEEDLDGHARIQNSRIDIGVDESGTGGVSVTGVSVSPASASIAVSGTQQLSATVAPTNASNQNVTWSSSNSSVATVNSSGLVTGVTAGSATITATTVDGSFTDNASITVTGSGGGSGITIDGSLSDWSAISAIATASGQSALSLKVHDDGTNLYFGVSGSGLGANYQVLLDIDNNPSTGLQHWSFGTSGADLYIENGTVATYTGDGTSWSWSTVGSATASKSSSVCEVQVAKSLLGSLASSINVAYADINSSWSVVSTLGFASFTLPVSASITIDGSLSDWSSVSAIDNASGQSALSLKAYDDGTYLYFGVSGSGLGAHYQVYLNTDNNSSSGLQHWDFGSSGADYYIEDGNVAEYTGDGSTWSWSNVGSATHYMSGSTVREVRVAKSLLGSLSSTITVGFTDINSSWSVVSTLGFSSFSTSGSRLGAAGDEILLMQPEVKIYPNPVEERLLVDLQGISGLAEITVHSMDGRLLFTQVAKGGVTHISRDQIKGQGLMVLTIRASGFEQSYKVRLK